jgi:hypothetical protein
VVAVAVPVGSTDARLELLVEDEFLQRGHQLRPPCRDFKA